jgi:hypothetical protein
MAPTVTEPLMQIVRSVSKYRDENGERIDNRIINWVFVKIMTNLPDCFVEIDDIEMIRQFFESRWVHTASIWLSSTSHLLNSKHYFPDVYEVTFAWNV